MREIIIEKLMFFVFIFCLFSLLVPLFGFMLYGKRGVKYLAEKARLKKKEKRFSNILGILFLALLIYIGSWLGAIGLWSSLIIENIKEAGMVKIWWKCQYINEQKVENKNVHFPSIILQPATL